MEIKADKRLNGWRTFHFIIIIGMYVFYAYIWADFLSFTGKPGWKGFTIFIRTVYTAPLYFLYHTITIITARVNKDKILLITSIGAMALCFIHCCFVFLTI